MIYLTTVNDELLRRSVMQPENMPVTFYDIPELTVNSLFGKKQGIPFKSLKL
jgi:hypothetical protein